MPKARRKPASPPPMPARDVGIGPTLETMRHGEYVRPEQATGVLVVYTNRRFSPLSRLHADRQITQRQYAGGLCFERTYTAVWGSPSPSRDSTQPGLGGVLHETERQAERMALGRARLGTILTHVGPAAYAQLVSVVVFGDLMGEKRENGDRYATLIKSLEECAKVYGVSE